MILSMMKTIWRRWKGFAHGIIRAQNWTLMAIAYITAVAPVAIIMRLIDNDMTDRGLGDRESGSYWLKPMMSKEDIRRAQRPW